MEDMAGTKRSRRWIWPSLLLAVTTFFLAKDLTPPRAALHSILGWAFLVLWCAWTLLQQLWPRRGSHWRGLENLLIACVFGNQVLPDLLRAWPQSSMTRGVLLATAALCGLIALFGLARRRVV